LFRRFFFAFLQLHPLPVFIFLGEIFAVLGVLKPRNPISIAKDATTEAEAAARVDAAIDASATSFCLPSGSPCCSSGSFFLID